MSAACASELGSHVASELAESLVAEARALLFERGLYAALEHVGRPIIHGSLLLNLMARRELDVRVVHPRPSSAVWNAVVNSVFKLDVEVLSGAFWYTDRPFFAPGAHSPTVFGELTLRVDAHCWKVDAVVVGPELTPSEDGASEPYNAAILAALADQPELRSVIVAIKRATYASRAFRRGHFRFVLDESAEEPLFYSGTIYEAVLQHGVRSARGFAEYLSTRHGIELGVDCD